MKSQIFFQGIVVFEIRKNLDLRKIFFTPKIFLKSRFLCILMNIFFKLSESAKVKILPPPPKAFRDPEMDKIKAEALIKINKNMADNKITIEKVMIDKVDADKVEKI